MPLSPSPPLVDTEIQKSTRVEYYYFFNMEQSNTFKQSIAKNSVYKKVKRKR